MAVLCPQFCLYFCKVLCPLGACSLTPNLLIRIGFTAHSKPVRHHFTLITPAKMLFPNRSMEPSIFIFGGDSSTYRTGTPYQHIPLILNKKYMAMYPSLGRKSDIYSQDFHNKFIPRTYSLSPLTLNLFLK